MYIYYFAGFQSPLCSFLRITLTYYKSAKLTQRYKEHSFLVYNFYFCVFLFPRDGLSVIIISTGNASKVMKLQIMVLQSIAMGKKILLVNISPFRLDVRSHVAAKRCIRTKKNWLSFQKTLLTIFIQWRILLEDTIPFLDALNLGNYSVNY